jgi:hypothetical protein
MTAIFIFSAGRTWSFTCHLLMWFCCYRVTVSAAVYSASRSYCCLMYSAQSGHTSVDDRAVRGEECGTWQRHAISCCGAPLGPTDIAQRPTLCLLQHTRKLERVTDVIGRDCKRTWTENDSRRTWSRPDTNVRITLTDTRINRRNFSFEVKYIQKVRRWTDK